MIIFFSEEILKVNLILRSLFFVIDFFGEMLQKIFKVFFVKKEKTLPSFFNEKTIELKTCLTLYHSLKLSLQYLFKTLQKKIKKTFNVFEKNSDLVWGKKIVNPFLI